MSLKVKIKAKGDDAEDILEGHLPGAGSNDSRKPDVGTPAGSAPNGAEEYYGQTDLGGHSKSYDESTQMSSAVREAHPGGVHRTQAEGPQGSQGERPAPSEVRTATVDKTVSKKAADAQVGSNRQYFNEEERRRNS